MSLLSAVFMLYRVFTVTLKRTKPSRPAAPAKSHTSADTSHASPRAPTILCCTRAGQNASHPLARRERPPPPQSPSPAAESQKGARRTRASPRPSPFTSCGAGGLLPVADYTAPVLIRATFSEPCGTRQNWEKAGPVLPKMPPPPFTVSLLYICNPSGQRNSETVKDRKSKGLFSIMETPD